MRPAKELIRAEMHDSRRSAPIVGDVAVTGQDGVGLVVSRFDADEIAEVYVAQGSEAGCGQAGIRWANDEPRRDQFGGERLEMAIGETKLAVDAGGVFDVFERTSVDGRDGHGKTAIVIVGKTVKGETILAQVVDTLDAHCPRLRLVKGGQKHGRQNGDDGDDT